MATSTRPGDVLAGRYRLIDLLSESGGGRFWRAHDKVLERYVALHVISEADPRASSLLSAARDSAKVLDSRILRVLDAETQDGLCFVVNEWGTGTSLDILVTHRGAIDPGPAAWMVAEIAEAMARAHEADVPHGRLNPENVLIDQQGGVKLIGLCVDAALHGLPPGRTEQDRADIGGLLYCALTARWPGPSASEVAAARTYHGTPLAPRQMVPGVPRSLDAIWREIDQQRRAPGQQHRWRVPAVGYGDHPDVSSAAAISERLTEFVGDAADMSFALAAASLPINQVLPVSLPALSDPPVRIEPRGTAAEPPTAVEPPTDADPASGADEPATQVELDLEQEPTGTPDEDDIPSPSEIRALTDQPTEAGMPVFGEDDEVSWMRARATPPPPPPPFEDPPERPLFAPETPEGAAARLARAQAASPTPVQVAEHTRNRTPGPGDYWPWDDTDHTGTAERVAVDDEEMPGRSWLRLALGVGLAVVLLVAVAVAFNVGRGRTPLGQEEESGPVRGSSPAPSVAPTAIPDTEAIDFDPFGTDGENPETAPLAVDGDPATAWRTSTYNDQLGPAAPALKPGVGLIIDLAENRTVTAVDLQLLAGEADVQVSVSRELPDAAPEEPNIGSGTVGSSSTIDADADAISQGTTTGRYLLVWFTSLPQVSDGFRAELAEVVVRGH